MKRTLGEITNREKFNDNLPAMRYQKKVAAESMRGTKDRYVKNPYYNMSK